MGALLKLPITQWEKDQNMEQSRQKIKETLETGDHFMDFEAHDDYYEVSESDIEEWYEECLDCDGAVTVAGASFYPSQILKDCDPIAYDCGLSDYRSGLIGDDYIEDNKGDLWRRD